MLLTTELYVVAFCFVLSMTCLLITLKVIKHVEEFITVFEVLVMSPFTMAISMPNLLRLDELH